MIIREGGLNAPAVEALLRFHYDMSRSVTPVGCAHVFDIERLRRPDIRFWSAWDGDALLGVGALKMLSDGAGEVKSMHVAQSARRRGVGAMILARIAEEAVAMGAERLYLETGAGGYFAPARALYARAGFSPCDPFEGYDADRNSVFMTRHIGAGA